MSNRMLVPAQKLIEQAVLENTNRKMLVDEVLMLVNNSLPGPKKMTSKQVFGTINIMSRCGIFILKKESKDHLMYYQFERREQS